MSGRRVTTAASALLAGLTVVVAAPSPATATHGGSPSAAAVAHSQQQVASREHQVAAVARRIGAAKVRARSAGLQAEIASEAYDGARVTLQAARLAVRTTQLVLAGANRRVAAGERAVASFATAAYETGGMSRIDALLQPGAAGTLVSQVSAIGAIATSQRNTLEQLDAARIYQGVVSRQAQVVADRATAAAAAADRARQQAQAAANRQATVLHRLQRQRQELVQLLGQARGRAARLARERLAAIARARRIAAARAAVARAAATPTGLPASPATRTAATPFADASGSTSGTVSASTAAAAVHEAESQIGKPYQWGAAGPNSYDCSGLVMWAYAQVGVSIDHWTGDQWNEGAHVARSQLRPGDLVFFAYDTADPSTIHHVGMYIGGGQMVEAPFTGANVRVSGAFRSDYIGAVRPYQR